MTGSYKHYIIRQNKERPGKNDELFFVMALQYCAYAYNAGISGAHYA